MSDPQITPELLLRGYAMGIFPMAESRENPEIHWIDPRLRGIFEIDGFHISRSLAREIRAARYVVTTDRAFEQVVMACADRPETWINDQIFALYTALHTAGFAHSVEVWDGPDLIGGVYGVTLGAAFFGESMFSRRTNGSKLALAALIERLRAGGYTLFDTQFLTPHLASLGAIEIPRAAYRKRLAKALTLSANFNAPADQPPSPSAASPSTGGSSGGVSSTSGNTRSGTSQRNTQTS